MSKVVKSEKKGSNLICRVSNVTPEMVQRYVQRLPKTILKESKFRELMGAKWFQNEHQAPEQWGLYYIDGTNYYPRFNRDITIKEAERYIYGWIKRLIVINPYTRFKTMNDSRLVESIVRQLEQNPDEHDLKSIVAKLIDGDEPFIINEIIVNVLNKYSEILHIKTINTDEEKFEVYLYENYKEILKTKYNMTKKEYFDSFNDINISASQPLPLQQIFYGAPGTGKSHKVKEVTDSIAKEFVFRTTFHPDSDYSTFVGAYKPTMKQLPIFNQQTGAQIGVEDKIVYSFVPQAFLKAYVAAWQNPEQSVFLVIEEINRGNCAQIFGDIFQLLDRKDGVSEYPIKADQDIRDYLAKEFAGYDLEANILSGEELVLPANLHIWATMNTSDQSLFPIDSAFKRRWDWKYMPIHDAGENWTIALSDVEYDWWDFVEKINNVIGNMTSSEDKKLGYFFCKACNGKINAETFVNKVVFYLWNDVFKDYELSDKAFQDGEGKLTFNKFYTPLGDANEATIKTLMENMGVELKEIDHEPESEEDENELEDSTSPAVTLRKQKCKEFWTDFLQYAQNNSTYMSIFSGRKTPTTDHWYTYNVFGRPLTYLCVDQFRRRNELVVSISMDKPSFAKLAELYKNEIEQKLQGMDLKWVQDLQKSTTKSNIREVLHVTNFEDPIERQQLFIHIVDRLIRMYGVFNEYFGKISE